MAPPPLVLLIKPLALSSPFQSARAASLPARSWHPPQAAAGCATQSLQCRGKTVMSPPSLPHGASFSRAPQGEVGPAMAQATPAESPTTAEATVCGEHQLFAMCMEALTLLLLFMCTASYTYYGPHGVVGRRHARYGRGAVAGSTVVYVRAVSRWHDSKDMPRSHRTRFRCTRLPIECMDLAHRPQAPMNQQ